MTDSVLVPGQPPAGASAFSWTGSSQAPEQAAPAVGTLDPDVAVRARLSAIVIDGIIVGIPIAVLEAALGSTARSPDTVLLFLGIQFLYFFAFELSRGQTIGKRQYHLRVVSRDGSPLTMRQVAIRNVLRFIDVLPLMYASGLLSMMRTGRTRRQRIGDVAAGTMVVLDPGGRRLRTPRWLLPLITLIAVVFSIGVIVAIADAQPAQPQFPALVGFAGSNSSEEPLIGTWQATGTTTWTAGYEGDYVGRQSSSTWTITRGCSSTSPSDCMFSLTSHLQGTSPMTVPLVPAEDGWHATFVVGVFPCQARDRTPAEWLQRATVILNFLHGGRGAEANEQNMSYADACGYGADGVSWTAERTP